MLRIVGAVAAVVMVAGCAPGPMVTRKDDQFTGTTTLESRKEAVKRGFFPLDTVEVFWTEIRMAPTAPAKHVALYISSQTLTWEMGTHDTLFALCDGDRMAFPFERLSGRVGTSGSTVYVSEFGVARIPRAEAATLAKCDVIAFKVGIKEFELTPAARSVFAAFANATGIRRTPTPAPR